MGFEKLFHTFAPAYRLQEIRYALGCQVCLWEKQPHYASIVPYARMVVCFVPQDIILDHGVEGILVFVRKRTNGYTPRLMKRCFEDSYLVDLYPDIETCDKTVRNLVPMLGTDRERDMAHYMKIFVSDQSTVLIDGTSLFTRNRDFYARKGYNPKHSQEK